MTEFDKSKALFKIGDEVFIVLKAGKTVTDVVLGEIVGYYELGYKVQSSVKIFGYWIDSRVHNYYYAWIEKTPLKEQDYIIEQFKNFKPAFKRYKKILKKQIERIQLGKKEKVLFT